MKRLKLLLLLAFTLSFFTGEAQVKNYTIEAITRLETQGTFIYQGSTISFTTAFLNKENGGTGIDGTGFTFYHSGNSNKFDVDWTIQNLNAFGNLTVEGGKDLKLRNTDNSSYIYIRNNGITNQRNLSIRFTSTGNDLFTLANNGNVGIGTTSAPSRKLDVAGSIVVSANEAFFVDNAVARYGKQLDHGAIIKGATGTQNSFVITTPSGQLLITNPVGTNNILINPTNLGNVGIGTTSAPTEKLEVNGNIKASGDVSIIKDNPLLSLKATNETGTTFIMGDNEDQVGQVFKINHSGGNITSFHTNGTEWLNYTGDAEVDFLKGVTIVDLLREAGSFTSGFGGNNWQLDPDDNALSHLTIDRLTVRDRMDVYELVINQIRATNGSLWVSDAVKVETVAGTTLNVNDDTDITFLANDIIKAQQFDGRNVRTYTATVATVGATSFTVSSVVGTGWDGMELVRIGNTTDTDRQGAVYITSSDSNAPYIDIIDGNTDTSLSGDVKGRFGRLDGITSATFGALSGYGFWTENGYLEGSINATGGEIAGWNINSESIYKDFRSNGYTVFMGIDPVLGSGGTSVRGFGITKDAGNRLIMGQSGSNGFELTGLLSGSIVFRLSTDQPSIIGGWVFTSNTLTGGNIILNSNGTISNSTHYSLNNDGSGFLAEGNISWTAAGVLDVDRITASDGTIGAFSIDATYIWTGTKQTADAYSVAGMTIGNGAIRAQKFRVDTDGTLYATDGNFSGTITGSTITGGTIQSATTGQRVVIESAGNTLSFYDSSNVQRIIMDDNLLASRPAIKITEGAFYATDGVSLSYMSEDLVLTPEIQADEGTITTLGSTTITATTTTTTNLTVSGVKQIDGSFTSTTDTDQFVSLAAFFPSSCIGGIVGGNGNSGVLQFIVRGSSGFGNIGLWVDRDNAYSGSFTVNYVAWGF